MVKSCPMKFGLTCYVAKKRDMLIKLFHTLEAVPFFNKTRFAQMKNIKQTCAFFIMLF